MVLMAALQTVHYVCTIQTAEAFQQQPGMRSAHLTPGEDFAIMEGQLENAHRRELYGAAPELALDLCIALKGPLAALSICGQYCWMMHHLQTMQLAKWGQKQGAAAS